MKRVLKHWTEGNADQGQKESTRLPQGHPCFLHIGNFQTIAQGRKAQIGQSSVTEFRRLRLEFEKAEAIGISDRATSRR